MKHNASGRTRALVTIMLLAVLILAQLAVITWFADAKDGFDVDELWTFGLANSYDEPFVTYEYGEWMDGSVLADYLTVGNHAHEYLNVYENQAADVHPPLYYLCIHAVCSVFKAFSKWNGIAVNMSCFAVTQIALFALSCRVLSKEEQGWGMITPEALGPVAVYGFGAGAVSSVVFIRMYAMMTMWAVLLALVLVLLWQKGQQKKRMFVLKAVLILGFLTQYYFLIFACMFCAVYFFACLMHVRQKEAKAFAGACITALLLAAGFFPWCLEHIFSGYRGREAMEHVTALNLGELANWANQLVNALSREQFAGMLPALLGAGALLVAVGLIRKKTGIDHFALGAAVCALLAGMAYLIVIAVIAPYKVDRYIFCIFPLIAAAVWIVLSFGLHGLGVRAGAAALLVTAVLLGADAGTLVTGNVNYLFPGHDEYVRLSEAHGSLPCIVRGDYYLTKNLLELGAYDHIYVMASKETQEVVSALERYDAYDIEQGFVLYELFGEKEAVEQIVQATGAKDAQLIYKNRYDVYLIR